MAAPTAVEDAAAPPTVKVAEATAPAELAEAQHLMKLMLPTPLKRWQQHHSQRHSQPQLKLGFHRPTWMCNLTKKPTRKIHQRSMRHRSRRTTPA